MDRQVKTKPKLEVTNDEILHLLVPGEVGAVLELVLKDKDGKITQRRIMKSKSFLRQFLPMLWLKCQLLDGQNAPSILYSTDGDPSSMRNSTLFMACNAPINNDDYGILVGSGATSPTLADYALETLIVHGTGSGQLQYSAVTFGAPSSDATTSQFTITRDFANGSGTDVVVREIGLAVRAYTAPYVDTYHLLIRDVISAITVPNGQTLTVNYRIQTVV